MKRTIIFRVKVSNKTLINFPNASEKQFVGFRAAHFKMDCQRALRVIILFPRNAFCVSGGNGKISFKDRFLQKHKEC